MTAVLILDDHIRRLRWRLDELTARVLKRFWELQKVPTVGMRLKHRAGGFLVHYVIKSHSRA